MDSKLAPAASQGRIRRQWIEATITRVDGTVEQLGVISDSRISWRVKQAVRRLFAPFVHYLGKDS